MECILLFEEEYCDEYLGMVIITVVRALRQQGIHENGPITRHADMQNAGNPSIENEPGESPRISESRFFQSDLVQRDRGKTCTEMLCPFTVLRTYELQHWPAQPRKDV